MLQLLLLMAWTSRAGARPTRKATGPLPDWSKEMGSLESPPKKKAKPPAFSDEEQEEEEPAKKKTASDEEEETTSQEEAQHPASCRQPRASSVGDSDALAGDASADGSETADGGSQPAGGANGGSDSDSDTDTDEIFATTKPAPLPPAAGRMKNWGKDFMFKNKYKGLVVAHILMNVIASTKILPDKGTFDWPAVADKMNERCLREMRVKTKEKGKACTKLAPLLDAKKAKAFFLAWSSMPTLSGKYADFATYGADMIRDMTQIKDQHEEAMAEMLDKKEKAKSENAAAAEQRAEDQWNLIQPGYSVEEEDEEDDPWSTTAPMIGESAAVSPSDDAAAASAAFHAGAMAEVLAANSAGSSDPAAKSDAFQSAAPAAAGGRLSGSGNSKSDAFQWSDMPGPSPKQMKVCRCIIIVIEEVLC